MGWKEWPAWVKGGVIGLYICVFFYIVWFAISEIRDSQSPKYPEAVEFIEMTLDPFNLLRSISVSEGTNLILLVILFVVPLLEYFIFGVFIGWLVGKIKERKR